MGEVFEGLGKALRFLRQNQDKSQKEVAEAAGVTPPMVSAYENDRTSPEIETLDKILRLGLDSNLRELCDALDIVNKRLPGDLGASALGFSGLRRGSASSAARAIASGGPLPPLLQEGYREITQGLLKLVPHFLAALETTEGRQDEGTGEGTGEDDPPRRSPKTEPSE